MATSPKVTKNDSSDVKILKYSLIFLLVEQFYQLEKETLE